MTKIVVTILTQNDLTSPIGWLEETVEGTINTSGTMAFFGPCIRFAPTHGRAKVISPHAGNEDVRETKYAGAQVANTTVVFKVVGTNMIKYFSDLEDGAGTCENSSSMAASINVHGTTKYWLAEFCRPAFGLVSSGRDLEIIGLVTMNHKFDLPLGAAWTSKPTLATDPGSSTSPSWRFSDGGDNPVTWDGDDMDCENIKVMFDRIPITRNSAGGTDLAVNKCGGRRIRFRMDLGNDTNAQNLLSDYQTGTPKDLVWTLDTGVAVITLANCILDPIAEEFLTAEEDPEVTLTLSGEATTATWST